MNLKQTLRTRFPRFVRVSRDTAVDMTGATVSMRGGWHYVQAHGQEYRVSRLRWPAVAGAFSMPIREGSVPQRKILSLLGAHPQLHISELAELTDRSPASTSQLVDGMRKRGLVKSRRDGFRVYVSLPA